MRVVGLSIIAVGLWVLAWDVEGWNTAWFLFAWVGWLVLVDGQIHRLGGASFVRERRRELGAMLLWSVPFWMIFEGYNLVIHNWTYVFLPRSELWQGVFAFLAFATVLPACFFHAALLEAWGFDPRGPRVPIRGPVEWAVGGLGLLCIVLPLVWPRWAFWMVWGALLGLPAVLNYRLGSPSLLRDLEQGRWGRLDRLFVGGVLSGGLWEGLNYWARTKWVYTVPGFEELKLFEMPLLGFVGFPFLALSAFESYSLWCWVARGGRHWERPDSEQPRLARRHEWIGVGALLLFSFAADRFPLDPAVLSLRPLLSEIDGLSPQDRVRLREQGIGTPEQLVRFGTAPQGAMEHAEMALHKGMGAEHARLVLAQTGGFVGLERSEPVALHRALMGAAEAVGVRPPTLAQVKIWVRAAQGGVGRR